MGHRASAMAEARQASLTLTLTLALTLALALDLTLTLAGERWGVCDSSPTSRRPGLYSTRSCD